LEVLESDEVHVEHIMAAEDSHQRGTWRLGFLSGSSGETERPKFVDRIGNMTLFAGARSAALVSYNGLGSVAAGRW